jgi:hypothetical protein
LGDIVIGQDATLILDSSEIVQVASAFSSNRLISAGGDGIGTDGDPEKEPGLEEKAVANESESEDNSTSYECR